MTMELKCFYEPAMGRQFLQAIKKVLAKFHTIKHLFLHHRVLAKCLNPKPLRPPGFAISKMNCNILPIPESFSSQIKVLLLNPKTLPKTQSP
jgi:hypothetical protein